MRILFAGGGTAGHVNPAVAVANYIKEKEPESEFLFIGTEKGMESTLIPKQGYDIRFIKIHGFERKLSLKNIKTVGEIFSGIRNVKKIIKEFKPDVVVGTGGYVTGPVLFAAAKMKLPTLVHEANAYPGVTVRILSRFVDIVALSMAEAGKFISKSKRIEVTGNPVRPSILAGDQKTAKEKLGLGREKVILIFGGSLGAEKINSVAADWIAKTAEDGKYQIIMSTGKNNQYEKVMKRFSSKGIRLKDYPNVRVSEYIYDMDLALNAADLIVARSGGSVSEMTALGKAAILIPSPYVAGNHQEHNARAVEKSGGAIVICEDELSVETLEAAVEKVLGNEAVLEKMKKGSKSIGIPDATDKIYRLIKELLADKK
ncbi:MAG: undecaprenyldiphospho-muramoylpentapeptide beta-N-acetylglucosaminyltransferase [Ruminococcaceae bacterium]|nr:undecaprenyldiphospho-muramoylpentapeptide beta-N-acetylglucosaminyltransferase [Oscillospiraceae bacterium]